jgi:hypothetical protein
MSRPTTPDLPTPRSNTSHHSVEGKMKADGSKDSLDEILKNQFYRINSEELLNERDSSTHPHPRSHTAVGHPECSNLDATKENSGRGA